MDRETLNRIAAVPLNAQPGNEHLEQCPACGQMFSALCLGDVLHHLEPDHAPLPVHWRRKCEWPALAWRVTLFP